MKARLVVVVAVLFGSMLFSSGFADLVNDRDALIDFIASVPHRSGILNWYPFTSVCDTWTGIMCNMDKSRIVAVHLSGIELKGIIPPNTLSRLTALQTLSLHSNSLSGSFPPDFARLSALTEVQLQINSLSGPLPFNFSVWPNLSVLDLSFNFFNGSIPPSIANATQLSALNLSNNLLSGKIPDLRLSNLRLLNLSNNHLKGVVPNSLLKFPNSSFSGNPLFSSSPPIFSPSFPPPVLKSKGSWWKLKGPVLLGVIIGGCIFVLVVIALFLTMCCLRRKDKDPIPGKVIKEDKSEKTVAVSLDEDNRLVFFEGCTFNFDLEDLLRSSAEVLGRGTHGMAYKAILEDSTIVVVKRIKDVNVGKREFEQQMELVGKIKHENLVELRAYYYSKDEKFIVYDYYSLGSVFTMLHGRKRDERNPLDWEGRLRVALGAARGIAHIHGEGGGKLVHGNIKSSNIFLNRHFYGCVSDLGVTTLINHMTTPVCRTVGYRAPEVVEIRRPTQASDVYSFGVVLLELLTGKSPIQVMGGSDDVVHLVRWVQSVVREEWTAEVFDVDLMRFPNIEEEMVEMLQIAMGCVSRIPDQRPKMSDVVKMITDMRRLDSGNRASSEARSEGGLALPPEEGSSNLVRPSSSN